MLFDYYGMGVNFSIYHVTRTGQNKVNGRGQEIKTTALEWNRDHNNKWSVRICECAVLI